MRKLKLFPDEPHRLYGVLFAEGLTEDDIPMEDSIREKVNDMCNLGEGIRERAEARGCDAKTAKIITKMHQNGYSIDEITKIVGKTESEVQLL